MKSSSARVHPRVLQRGSERTECMTSSFDDIEFPASDWQDVRRYKWDGHLPMTFYGPDACKFEVSPISRMKQTELISSIKDPSFWTARWDLVDVRHFVLNVFPTFGDMKEEARVTELYEHLKVAMGGPDVKRQMTWPVVRVLASRRSSSSHQKQYLSGDIVCAGLLAAQ